VLLARLNAGGSDTGGRRLANAAGVVFKVRRAGGNPIVEIDVRGFTGGSGTDVADWIIAAGPDIVGLTGFALIRVATYTPSLSVKLTDFDFEVVADDSDTAFTPAQLAGLGVNSIQPPSSGFCFSPDRREFVAAAFFTDFPITSDALVRWIVNPDYSLSWTGRINFVQAVLDNVRHVSYGVDAVVSSGGSNRFTTERRFVRWKHTDASFTRRTLAPEGYPAIAAETISARNGGVIFFLTTATSSDSGAVYLRVYQGEDIVQSHLTTFEVTSFVSSMAVSQDGTRLYVTGKTTKPAPDQESFDPSNAIGTFDIDNVIVEVPSTLPVSAVYAYDLTYDVDGVCTGVVDAGHVYVQPLSAIDVNVESFEEVSSSTEDDVTSYTWEFTVSQTGTFEQLELGRIACSHDGSVVYVTTLGNASETYTLSQPNQFSGDDSSGSPLFLTYTPGPSEPAISTSESFPRVGKLLAVLAADFTESGTKLADGLTPTGTPAWVLADPDDTDDVFNGGEQRLEDPQLLLSPDEAHLLYVPQMALLRMVNTEDGTVAAINTTIQTQCNFHALRHDGSVAIRRTIRN
jgi:hypothetical protein